MVHRGHSLIKPLVDLLPQQPAWHHRALWKSTSKAEPFSWVPISFLYILYPKCKESSELVSYQLVLMGNQEKTGACIVLKCLHNQQFLQRYPISGTKVTYFVFSCDPLLLRLALSNLVGNLPLNSLFCYFIFYYFTEQWIFKSLFISWSFELTPLPHHTYPSHTCPIPLPIWIFTDIFEDCGD